MIPRAKSTILSTGLIHWSAHVHAAPDHLDQSNFPIGAEGTAAIYTESGAWAALRKIDIRGYTWFNWLYPLN